MHLDDMFTFQWEESLDPDGNDVTYYYITSHLPNMSEIIAEPFEYQRQHKCSKWGISIILHGIK